MLEMARTDGAVIHEGMQLTAMTTDEDGADLVFDNETFRAKHVIAADGMWSPVRKFLGLSIDGYRGEWHAFRQYFENVSPRAASELIVWFEKDLLPGYAWSFPLEGNRANIGFGIQRGSKHYCVGDMKTLWPDLLDRPHIREALGPDARPEGPHKAWPIPARVGRVPLTGPRTMFVGDAAAVTDPMTGEGIGQAILTGRLAAEALLADGNLVCSTETTFGANLSPTTVWPDPHPALGQADRRWRCAEGHGRHCVDPSQLRTLDVRGLPAGHDRNPRRWHRGMFTGPGAYQDADR